MTNKSDSAGQSFDFVITRMITDRIGVHSVLLPGHQKEAVHSLDKNPSKRKKCGDKHRGFYRMGGGKWGSKRKICYCFLKPFFVKRD